MVEYREANTPAAYEYFKMLREEPEYRLQIMMAEIEAERWPACCTDDKEEAENGETHNHQLG